MASVWWTAILTFLPQSCAPRERDFTPLSPATPDHGFFNTLTSSLSRRVWVALLPSHVSDLQRTSLPLDGEQTPPFSTAVVIDTLRFTTTACQALELGAQSVQVASSVERAWQLAAELPTKPLLCGERHCHPIDGFDLGNSPLELTRELVHGRDLVFTTTNGTLAVEAVRHLPSVLLAGLVNRQSLCHYIAQQTSGNVLLVCAGTDGQLTWEDVLTAGALVDGLRRLANFQYGHDTALLALYAWQASVQQCAGEKQLAARLEQELSRALGGRNLLESGYQRDVHFAAQLDSLAAVAGNSAHHPHRFTLANH